MGAESGMLSGEEGFGELVRMRKMRGKRLGAGEGSALRRGGD